MPTTFRFGFVAVMLCQMASVGSAETLSNDLVEATFDDKGLVSIRDKKLGRALRFAADDWTVIVESNLVDSAHLAPREPVRESNALRYKFKEGATTVEALYELKPGWRFLTKQLFITNAKEAVYTVKHVDVFRGTLENDPSEIHTAGLGEKYRQARSMGDYAAFARMEDGWGAMFMMQNPFMNWEFQDGAFSMDYRLDMDWKTEYGPFASDRACIGLYEQTGRFAPTLMEHRSSWLMEPVWEGVEQETDMGEVEAAIECVKAFLLYMPDKSERIHVPWCENDYQIDVATDEGVAQYKRIVDTCAALDVGHMVYTVRNTDIATKEDTSDNWRWEHLLWLNQGIQIRKNEWDPHKDALPAKTRELMDYAEGKGVKLMAYVYPTLDFEQSDEWIVNRAEKNPQRVATFASRAFQDWFIDALVVFKERNGLSGYAFDYWSMKVGGDSYYAQWFGARRVLEELRRRAPDVIIDGRQQYHGYGPWIWLAGTYPHPTGGDEQPESFESFPDLHFDRCSANQQRLTTYWFRNVQFCPTELMPGFIGHQTARKDGTGEAIFGRDFNIRDWDYLGWKYSLISSVATAPFAHCVDMVPARDEREFDLFMKDKESQQFMTDWFDWTDTNAETLRHLRSITGPPAIGRADGTAAINGDRGFIFLFNPNHRKVEAEFTLDESIGLTEGQSFVLTRLYPEEGMRVGVFNYGERASLPMDGTTAWALDVRPVEEVSLPLLLNVRGKAELDGDLLRLTEVQGEVGAEANVLVKTPDGAQVKRVTINGQDVPFEAQGGIVTARTRFSRAYFPRNRAVTEYDPTFTGTEVAGSFKIPKRIFRQLKERKKEWSFDWTEEDLQCTWLAPERLLLYIQIAEPDWKMEVSIKLNGEPVEVKKAYSSRTPGRLKMGKGHSTFTGFYVDVSDLKPDREYKMEVTLPPSLKPGQFQGVFFVNVETEYTDKLAVEARQ